MSFRPTARRLLLCLATALWTLSGLAGGSRVEIPKGPQKAEARRSSSDGRSGPAGSPTLRPLSGGGAGLVPIVRAAERFAVSPPLGAIRAAAPHFDGDREIPRREFRRERGTTRGPDIRDPVVQSSAVTAAIPSPLTSFEGSNNKDNANVLGGYVYPPDTVGDVGPNHYVQAVNLLLKVFSKSGTALLGPLPMSTLFSPLGGACAASDDGDPIVLYDPLADRWLVSQIRFSGVTPDHQCVALTRTGDPTGSWFLYDFTMPNSKLNDYPKFGVWPDAYYMSDNQFNPDFQGAGVFAFDRTKMLAGDPTASYVYFDLDLLDPTIGGLLPSDLDGLKPPPAGAPNVFAYFTATEFGDAQDGLRLFSFHADFGNPGASTFTERSESPVAVASFDPTMNEVLSGPTNFCGMGVTYDYHDDIPQPSTNSCQRLDSLSDRLMFRLAYRNFGAYESLVTTHSVDVSFSAATSHDTHHAGVRYYELRRSLPAGSFAVNEQASFAPDSDHRWMGSAAMDASGDLAVGYSVSSSTTYPSIRYAGRLAGDPPNGLGQGETTLIAGGGVQTANGSRWGDYSALSVDPVDECTFWYTTEYYSSSPPASCSSIRCWQTRIGSFKFSSCVTPARGTIQGTVTDAGTSALIAGARVVMVDAGGASYEAATNGSGVYSRLLSPGGYTATASATGYSPSAPTAVNVTDSGTTTQNFALGAPGASPTPSPTATRTPTPTPTSTPVPPTATRTPTSTPVPPTATQTPTSTPLPPTATQTPTSTPIPPTATQTPTPTPLPPTATQTPTSTPLPPTATQTPTSTPLPPTATQTPTSTPLPPTATQTPTSTPLPPTATQTPTPTPLPPTATQTPTSTPLPPTATRTPTPTPLPPTATQTPTPTPLPPTATQTPTPTPIPPTATLSPTPTPTLTSPAPSPTPTPTPTLTPPPATPTPTPTSTPTPTPPSMAGANFNTLAPCRIADTRNAPGPLGGPSLVAGATRDFPVSGVCGVPPSAKAVAVNLTVVSPTDYGHLTLYPAGASLPLASTINFRPEIVRANNAVLPLGTGGQISVFCGMPSGSTDFVLDVTGYFE